MNLKPVVYHMPSIPVKGFVMTLMMLAFMSSCKVNDSKAVVNEVQTIGTIERLDPAFDALVSEDAIIEVISEGYDWSEGTLWVESHKMLLFSDVPKNTIYKWTEEKGTEVYLTPSGYTGSEPSQSREPGSNGLALTPDGKLALCQHGDRRVSVMDAPLDSPAPKYIPLADNYEGKKFDSPNDLTFAPNGDLYFTDPPYGLPQQASDPTKENPFQGVYRTTTNGQISLLVDSLTRPNGIAVTPDEKTLIVANSDPEKAVWYAFDLSDQGVSNGRIFYDATSAAKAGAPGLPDGFRIDKQGNVFATGPGGIWVFDKDGKLLGKLVLPVASGNCALADDDKTLYIAADMHILRVKLRD